MSSKLFRCQFCNYSIAKNKDLKGIKSPKYKMGLHYETKHKKMLPDDMSGFRFFYFLETNHDRGSCAECHGETEFNEIRMKYSRFCNNPKCKQAYVERTKNRMIAKYGKAHLLNDPEMQKKMLAGRKISGEYLWSDGKTKLPYVGSFEHDFLRYLDKELHWPVSDIFAPSPHTYEYEYNGEKHFYIPDFFIPSLNLECEIKDDGSAKNINSESREKDKIKDDLMRSVTNLFNYIKIINKDYTKFNELLK